MPATSITSSPVRPPDRDALMRHLDDARHRHARALPDPVAGAAGVRRFGESGAPDCPETPVADGSAPRSARFRCIPGLADADVDLVASEVSAWQPEHPSAPAPR